MAILVDQPLWTFRGEKWAHLVSDSNYDELHRIANQVGIRRIGFQGDHYDLPARLLPAALDAGATQVDSRVLVRRLRAAGLRKPASYEGWTPLLRRDAVSIVEARNEVARLLDDSPGDTRGLLASCEAIWTTLRNEGCDLHQLFVLARPSQCAVAFDAVPAAREVLRDVEAEPPTEIWITGWNLSNPRLSIDVLQTTPS